MLKKSQNLIKSIVPYIDNSVGLLSSVFKRKIMIWLNYLVNSFIIIMIMQTRKIKIVHIIHSITKCRR